MIKIERIFRAVIIVVLAFGLLLAACDCGCKNTSDVEIIRDVEYGKAGDISLLLDIYIPATRIATPTPAVIFIHGGGWHEGNKHFDEPPSLSRDGFVFISINYRLVDVAQFPAAVEDCKCAVRWLRANAKTYGVDPDQIGVVGTSAGGYLALMVALVDKSAGLEGNSGWAEYSSRVQAVCSLYGSTDFSTCYDDNVVRFLGGTPTEEPDKYKFASPITHLTTDDPPLLLVHGELDEVVPITQSEEMYLAYQQAGLDVTLIKVPGAHHGFDPITRLPPSSRYEDIYNKIRDFFAEHLLHPE